jgi:hypothetical protein
MAVDAPHRQVEHRNIVDAGDHARRHHHRRDAARAQIGAEIGQHGDAQAEDAAGRIERQRGGGALVARLHVAQTGLHAAGDPTHRAAEPARRPQHQHGLGIERVLGAEAAADVARDRAHAIAFDMEDVLRDRPPDGLRLAGGAIQREAVGRRIIGADVTARLDRVLDQARDGGRELDDVGRARERRGGARRVADREREADIVGEARPHHCGARPDGGARVGHAGARRVVDVDQLGGLLGA